MDAEPPHPASSLPGNLPPEIWHHIVTFLFWSDRTALKALAQTSQALYPVAASALFRTLHLEIHGGLEQWPRSDSSCSLPVRCSPFIRAIVVTGSQPWDGGFDGVDALSDAHETMLYHLFATAKKLQRFYWWYEKYMPGVILRRLYEVSPSTEVHILSAQVALTQRMHMHMHRLNRGAPQLACLRSVAAEWYRGEYDQLPNQGWASVHRPASLKEIIVRSPRLTHLSLTRRPTWRRGQRWADAAPRKEADERAAEAEERGLISLADGDRLPGTLAHLAFRGMRFGATQSRRWATQLRWEGVRSLALVEVDWVHLLPVLGGGGGGGQLRALVWLELGMPRLAERDLEGRRRRTGLLEAFLRALSRPLRSFIGVDLPADVVAVVAETHGADLQHLRLRTSSGDATLALEQLHRLPEDFPYLRSLGFALSPSQYDMISLLVPLRRLPHLHHLELNFRTLPSAHHSHHGLDNIAAENDSLILESTNIHTLFHRLDITDGPHLRSCHILHGDWNSLDHPPYYRSEHDAILVAERDRTGSIQVSRLPRWRRPPGPHAPHGTPTSSLNLVGRTLEVGGWPGMAGEEEAGLTTTAVAVDMGWGVRDARWGRR
ncbi:hypothetical protein BP00DRAFT_453751 [Aspergillus indologenus CBS 114.80]|uniref:F-box domain-containing protein n=1 Tax=Aspergillus indologenus CBS 114.80 TaxID=1450541 RepID=A0A2V5IG93_9EURO|nr:hypothetical protein BP00DRAFT_453751 [Aspergillus indologenus CBS 114.80]